MLGTVARALAVRSSLGIEGVATEQQVEAAIAAAGLELWDEAPLAGRVYGLLHDRVVYVKRGLLPATRRVVKAHEFVHHLNGDATAYYRPVAPFGGPETRRGEWRAQVGAYALLLGQPAPDLPSLTAQVRWAHDHGGLPWDFLAAAVSLLAAL